MSKWWAISRALEGMSAPLDTVMTLQDTPSSVSKMKPSSMAPIHCLEPTKVLGLSPTHKSKSETIMSDRDNGHLFQNRRPPPQYRPHAAVSQRLGRAECRVLCLLMRARQPSSALVSALLTLWAHDGRSSRVVRPTASPMSTRVRWMRWWVGTDALVYCCRRSHEQIVCSERYAQPHPESSNRSCACMNRFPMRDSIHGTEREATETERPSLQREVHLTRHLKQCMPSHPILSSWLCHDNNSCDLSVHRP